MVGGGTGGGAAGACRQAGGGAGSGKLAFGKMLVPVGPCKGGKDNCVGTGAKI
jgi:hypothetical protein